LIADDGGIVLRYMDNFAEGYFYTYNPSDGPVFGVSSFTHGILADFFAYTHLLSPLNSLFASNFISLVLTAFLVLRLLSYYLTDDRVIPFVWLAVMLTPAFFVINIKQGLETPLHLATLLLCFYLFLSNGHACCGWRARWRSSPSSTRSRSSARWRAPHSGGECSTSRSSSWCPARSGSRSAISSSAGRSRSPPMPNSSCAPRLSGTGSRTSRCSPIQPSAGL
jgi:hypothetical protein